MLGLVTHLPNFFLIREETLLLRKKKKENSGFRDTMKLSDSFELIHISLLREYLELEFSELKEKINFEFNMERIIDDFLFICFFIGNDFLPSLNTLDIEEGSLDKIFEIYKNAIPQMTDYISFHGKIDFKNAQVFFKSLAKLESDSLQSQLKKLEFKVKERQDNRVKVYQEKKKLIVKQKYQSKKEKHFKEKIEKLNIDEKKILKKKLISKKVDKLKFQYEKEVISLGCFGKIYEEDVIRSKNGEPIFNVKKDVKNKDVEDDRNLTGLFDSSDEAEGKPKNPNLKKNDELKEIVKEIEIEERKSLYVILKESEKYYNFIRDENYYSDIKLADINNSDLSEISDVEVNINYNDGFDEETIKYQDFEKVFQQKLINLYINDVEEAKNFYYKEKVKLNLKNKEVNEKKVMLQKYLEGLQWVLFYYYRGITSWKWFYPYHYPPFISDLTNIEEILDFDIEENIKNLKSEPLLPYQSLIMILPKNSKKLLPPAYHEVYDLYPEDYPSRFVIDFNGKRMPWEALAILPFIDQEKLIKFEETIREKYRYENMHLLPENDKYKVLSSSVLERNKYGENWIYLYKEDEKYICELKTFKFINLCDNYFPILKQKIKFDDNLHENSFNYSKKASSYISPTFADIKFQYFFNKAPDIPSKNKKVFLGKKPKVLCVSPKSKFDRMADTNAKEILTEALKSNQIFINWPFKKLAKLVGIVYYNEYMYLDSSGKLKTEQYKFPNDMRSECLSFLNSKGIYLEPINTNIFLEIVPFDRYVRSQNGKVRKLFFENDRYFTPIEISSINSDNSYAMYKNFLQSKVDFYDDPCKEFTKGDLGIILTNSGFGSLIKVDKIINNSNKDYNKLNEMNYKVKYYDMKVNYDLTENDWNMDLIDLYKSELIQVTQTEFYGSKTINEENGDDFFDSNNISSQKTKQIILQDNSQKKLVENIGNLSINQLFNTSGQKVYSPTFNYECAPTKSIKNILKKTEEFFISLDDLAKEMGISNWTLSIISSCVYIVNDLNEEVDENAQLSDIPHWNIGLNIKSNKGSKLILPGYTRFVYGEKNCYSWEFSTLACNLLKEYQKRFAPIFNALEKKNDQVSMSKFFTIYELFDDQNFDPNYLDEVVRWISTQEISSVQFCTINSNFINYRDIKKVQEFVQNKLKVSENNETPQTFVLNPNYIVLDKIPYVEKFGDIQKFSLGDRVINIRSDDKKFIPFGLKGTVTGIIDNNLEVLFDFPFIDSDTCGGRLPEGYGSIVDKQNLINMSSKASVFLRRNKESFEPINYKNITNHMEDLFEYPNNINKNQSHKEELTKTKSTINEYDYNQSKYNKKSEVNKIDKRMSVEEENKKKIIMKNNDGSLSTRNEEKFVVNDNLKEKISIEKEDKEKNSVDDFFEKHAENQSSKTSNDQYPQKKILQNYSNSKDFVQSKNISAYKTYSRLFKNEKLEKNKVYMFAKDPTNYEAAKKKNSNII